MELHHIVPKCMGGEDKRSNLVMLSPVAHAIISVYQCEHYQKCCFHRRQLKYLPEELVPLARYWLREHGRMANAARKTTARSDACRERQRIAALKPGAQPPHKKAAQSRAVTDTNNKKQPCPTCGKLMNIGNLTQHIRRAKCETLVG